MTQLPDQPSSTFLPDAGWRREAGLAAVVAALSDHDRTLCRYVGGAVRDTLIGRDVTDVDLATPLVPQEVIARLEAAGLKAVPTGIDHGTITAVADGKGYEVTTLRRDVATDGRRATIAFSTDWKEDAARRDFTINALSADPVSGAVFDYFGGLDDLGRRHIRFIGAASERIAEDHLRILRYFRFMARFGESTLDAEAYAACRDAAASLKSLSRERIATELLQLLATARPAFVTGAMVEGGIFASFLPEILPDAAARLTELVQREEDHDIAPDGLRRLAALLPADAALADRVAARLKLSRRARKYLTDMAALPPVTAPDARAAAYAHGLDLVRDAILVHTAGQEHDAALALIRKWQVPLFPMKGGQLVARGIKAGPDVARTLRHIEQQWVEEGFPDARRIDEIADQAISEYRRDS